MHQKKSLLFRLKDNITDGALSYFDWIIFIVLSILCSLCFIQGDILHTAGSSFAYLNGHIWDFYEYNQKHFTVNNYYPSTYILFAIWNIPIKLMGLYPVPTTVVSLATIMWFKLLPVCFYLYSAILVYKIALSMGMGESKSMLCAYAFLTTPIAFFSQFIFGQYDIFTVFFMLLGIYFFLKKDMIKFVLFFGIAITFKYFALLFFLPMLLLREKNYYKIFICCLAVMIPIAIETAIYMGSSAFVAGVLGFGVVNYILEAGTVIHGQTHLSFVVIFLLLCYAWAYFINTKDRYEEVKWMLFFSNIVVFLCFGFSMWNPQWLLLAVPFLVLSTFINKKFDTFIILDVLCMLFFVMFTINTWPNHVDQAMLNTGVLKDITKGSVGKYLTMADIFMIKNTTILYSCFSATLLINVVFKYPKFCLDQFSDSVDKFVKLIRVRFLVGISTFLVPATICLISIFIIPGLTYSVPLQNIAPSEPILTNQPAVQVFTPSSDSITSLEVLFGTYIRENHSQLNMKISNYETNEVLYATILDVALLKDNSYNKIRVPNITVERGQKYYLIFESPDATLENCVTIYANIPNNNPQSGFAVKNGEKQDYNLCVNIYGK